MKDGQASLFQSLKLDALAPLMDEGERGKESITTRTKKRFINRLPGEVHLLQLDLNHLIIKGQSATEIQHYLGKLGPLKIEDAGGKGKVSNIFKVKFPSVLETGLGLLTLLWVSQNRGGVTAMFPYSVVSKKSVKNKKDLPIAQGSLIISADAQEEYDPLVQLEIVADVLLKNGKKVISLAIAEPEDLSRPVANDEVPSVLRLLSDAGWLNHFISEYRANVVDELDEILQDVNNRAQSVNTDELEIQSNPWDSEESQGESDNLAGDDGPDYMKRRNNNWFKENIEEFESLSDKQEEEEIDTPLLWAPEEEALKEYYGSAEVKPRYKSLRKPSVRPQAPLSTYSYFRYDFDIVEREEPREEEKETIVECKQTLDHIEIEVSTKSEELIEENPPRLEKSQEESPPPTTKLSKSQRRRLREKEKKQELKNKERESLEIIPEAPQEAKPSQTTVEPIVEVQEQVSHQSSEDEDQGDMNDEESKGKEKDKQEAREFLRTQLEMVPKSEDLDLFENEGLAAINSQPGLSKKMKQKARKRLRQAVEVEKAKREEIQKESVESLDLDEQALQCLIGEFGQFGMVEKELRSKLATIGYILPTSKPKEKSKPTPSKWKEQLQSSINTLQTEMNGFDDKMYEAQKVHNLLSFFSGSPISKILTLLEEGPLGPHEPFLIDRGRKETRVIFRLPDSSQLAKHIFEG